MVTVAAGVAIAVPGVADTPPGPQISAINNNDTVRTVDDPGSSAQAQIAEAEAEAKAARKAARQAVTAANKARRVANQLTHYAQQTRRSSDVRNAQLAQAAARKAAAKMRSAKQAAKRATDRAAAMRQAATRSATTQQRGFVAGETAAPGATTTSDQNRASVLDLANRARSAAGCGALSYNAQLERSAQGHAEDMQQYNYMGHVSHDGRTFDQRIRAAGFDGGRIGENVGAGFSNADAVVDAWMHSPSHRDNILDCRFHYLGVGYALNGGYWVQNFGA